MFFFYFAVRKGRVPKYDRGTENWHLIRLIFTLYEKGRQHWKTVDE